MGDAIPTALDRKARLRIPPQAMPKVPAEERVRGWMEAYLPLDLETARLEAQRCIQCPAAPCTVACPAGNDIPGALLRLESGDVLGGAEVFRRTSTIPDMCGRLCPQEQLCEGACVVGKRGVPVAIARLEAFLGDEGAGAEPGPPPPNPSGCFVAIVGAGPAGLAAAEDLSKAGRRVTVFDAWPSPGGLLVYGIPNFKLDKAAVRRKIERLRAGGVEFVGDVRVGEDVTVDALFGRGCQAVLLTYGAGEGRRLGLPGEDLPGVLGATEFLVRANVAPDLVPQSMRSPLDLGRRLAVIGGGDTAMDCVRTAVRLGVDEVLCLYRRTKREMPGREVERIHAWEEGVRFQFLAAPLRFEPGDSGLVARAVCVRMELGEPDGAGRRRPVVVPDSEFAVEADTFVVAAGYSADRLVPATTPGLQTRDSSYLVVDPETGCTDRPGVFAAGDNVTGPDLVVTAMAAGRRAAAAIDRYLREANDAAA